MSVIVKLTNLQCANVRTYTLTVKFFELQFGIPKYGAAIEAFVVTNVVVLTMTMG